VFWLSHHHPDEFGRCYRFGSVQVCARCLGTYPVLALTLLLQLVLHAPLSHPLDVPVGVALVLPATLDWAVGRLNPALGSNPWRSTTGLLLGLGLGRSLFIHLQRPLPVVLMCQATVVTMVGVAVILVAYRRKNRR
jgi:uncharacterized membrane protein